MVANAADMIPDTQNVIKEYTVFCYVKSANF